MIKVDKRKVSRLLILSTLTAVLASCNFMNEDMPECATDPNVFTRVKFLYDYNVKKTDLFTDHVGSVYLYIFDENGVFLERREHTREYTSDPGFEILLDSTELRPGSSYQLLALANGNHKGYDNSLNTPGFQKGEMIPGVSTINDYRLTLDVDGDGDVDIFSFSQRFEEENIEQLDTVWTTLTPQYLDVPVVRAPFESIEQFPDSIVDVTIPLMRITNHITVHLAGSNFTMNTNPEDFHILLRFPHGNGEINITGETLGDRELFYRSIRKTMEPQGLQTEANYSATLKAEFNVSRLQDGDGASLQVWNADGTKLLAELFNISSLLAAGKDAYDDPWSNQEYLDREYEYELYIELDDTTTENPKIYWVEVRISVLGWAVRFQDEKI